MYKSCHTNINIRILVIYTDTISCFHYISIIRSKFKTAPDCRVPTASFKRQVYSNISLELKCEADVRRNSKQTRTLNEKDKFKVQTETHAALRNTPSPAWQNQSVSFEPCTILKITNVFLHKSVSLYDSLKY